MSLLQAITLQFTVLYNQEKNIEKASVTTAFPIDDAMREKILAKTASLVGNKTITLENKIDESIIGGFILRVGDIQIDASVLNKIGKLKRELKDNLYLSN
jgi:F-type H+-transporting ATPase subunit delta